MQPKLLYVLGASLAVMGLTVWLSYPRYAGPEPGKTYRYMHCPVCGKERPYDAKLFEKGCFRCGKEQPVVPTMESVAATGGPPNPYARMIPPLVIEVNVLLAILWYISRPGQHAETSGTEYFHTVCSHCKRRLRYPAQKVGCQGLCPGCKRPLVFSAEPAEEPDRE